MFTLDIFLTSNIIFSVLYSIVITSLIIGSMILFSISILDFNLLSPIKYMFTNGIKRALTGAGKTIDVGLGAASGVEAGFQLHDKYERSKKTNPAGPSSSNTTQNKNTPSKAKPSNPTPRTKPTPNTKPTSTPAKSSLLIWALNYLNINVSENSTDMFKFLGSIMTLEILALSGFINLLFYFISNLLILKYDIESKFNSPIIKRIINFYVKSSIYFIIFEIIITLFCILTILFIVSVVISSLI